MHAKLALKSVAAFALALLAGHFIFSALRASATNTPRISAASNAPDKNASSVQTVSERSPAYAPLTPGRPLLNIDRSFKVVDGGLKNSNMRMATTVSNVYAAGIEHALPYHPSTHIHWTPSGREIRIGDKVLAVNGNAGPIDAHLESHGSIQHVVYSSTYPATDEHLYIRPEGGIEHDIIVKDRPDELSESCGLAFTGYLTLSDDLTIWDGKKQIVSNTTTQNGLYFKNRLGNTLFYLRVPVAYDADVTLREGGLAVEKQEMAQYQKSAITCQYQITFDAKGIKLALVTPGKWLLDSTRAYPVTIDPSFGPFGLADGDPPDYIGSPGTGSIIPAHNGGTKLVIEDSCPLQQNIGIGVIGGNTGGGPTDNGYGHIDMPFDFTLYGFTIYGANSPTGNAQDLLFVHIDGWASPEPPFPKYDPFDPNRSPCFDFPQPANDNGAIPDGSYPNEAFYVLWNNLHFSNQVDPSTGVGSGIYWFTDGIAPNRRLVIEWYKMAYDMDTNSTDVISFNLVLYECQSIIEFIYGYPNVGEVYNESTIGIENLTGTVAVVYDQFVAIPVIGVTTGTGTTTPVDNIVGTAITFSQSPLGTVMVSETNAQGCVPLPTCFKATVNTTIPACVQESGGVSTPPSFGFHWIFGDGGEAFTPNVCHTYTVPGDYIFSTTLKTGPVLTVTDQLGNVANYTNNLEVIACDLPPVIMSVTPQGGTAPLSIDITCRSTSPFVQSATPPNLSGVIPTISAYNFTGTAITIDQLGPQNQPNSTIPIQTIIGGTMTTQQTQGNQTTPVDTISTTVVLDTPGTYQVTGVFPATSFTLPTVGKGTVFVEVIDPNAGISNALIITQSNFKIDWAGKIPNALGILPAPDADTITLTGYINLTGLSLSALAGQEITIALNAYNPIFDGFLDGNGHAVQGNAATGQTGNFQISLPSGKFTCSVKGDFAVSLGLASQNLQTLITANYGVQIGNLFSSTGTLVAYGYTSKVGKTATGMYKFGTFFGDGSFFKGAIPGAPAGTGLPGGQELLISGGFVVTAADFKLLGDTVSCTISGLMSRPGGDGLRPSATSNVVVQIGNYTETLNFTSTPTFKTTGKPPAQKFSFKAAKGSGTNIQTLGWSNLAGSFQLSAINLPNSIVGINPALGQQAVQFGITITPDNTQQFIGTTQFDVLKVSTTEFKH